MTLYATSVIVVIFGALMAALDLLLFAFAPFLFARLNRLPLARRAHAVLAVRYLPFAAALLLTVAVVVPAWWRFEPAQTSERASGLLLVLALLALAPLVGGLYRGARMFYDTRDRLLVWRREGSRAGDAHLPFPLVEVERDDLALCVGGYLRPTIYASSEVVQALDPEEFSAALAHEVSHARSRDPLRLLILAACPDVLQLFRLDRGWRSAFSTACEFAADAGASRGRPGIGLDLASALLKVARLRTAGSASARAMADVAVASAFSTPEELSARVHALASPLDAPAWIGARPQLAAIVALVAVLGGLIALGTGQAELVHGMTEELGRVLAP